MSEALSFHFDVDGENFASAGQASSSAAPEASSGAAASTSADTSAN